MRKPDTTNPHIRDGIERLRLYWPQSHAVSSKIGHCLIVVPSVILPKHFRENICSVLFVAPAGFPAARPENFFADIDVRLLNGAIPKCSSMFQEECHHPSLGSWPQWRRSKWWSWHLQLWDPNRSNLMSFMNAIRDRLQYAH